MIEYWVELIEKLIEKKAQSSEGHLQRRMRPPKVAKALYFLGSWVAFDSFFENSKLQILASFHLKM